MFFLLLFQLDHLIHSECASNSTRQSRTIFTKKSHGKSPKDTHHPFLTQVHLKVRRIRLFKAPPPAHAAPPPGKMMALQFTWKRIALLDIYLWLKISLFKHISCRRHTSFFFDAKAAYAALVVLMLHRCEWNILKGLHEAKPGFLPPYTASFGIPMFENSRDFESC